MTPNQLAAHIAAIRKDLAQDSAENAEALVLNLLRELNEPSDDQDHILKLLQERDQLRAQLSEKCDAFNKAHDSYESCHAINVQLRTQLAEANRKLADARHAALSEEQMRYAPLLTIANKLLAIFKHPTRLVTYLEQDQLEKAILALRDNQKGKLKHMSDEYKCPHCGSTKGTWFSRTEPMGHFCEDCGKDVDESPTPQPPTIASEVKRVFADELKQPPAMPDVLHVCNMTKIGNTITNPFTHTTSYTRTDLLTERAKIAAKELAAKGWLPDDANGVVTNQTLKTVTAIIIEAMLKGETK